MDHHIAARDLWRRISLDLAVDWTVPEISPREEDVPLPARTDVAALAWASVAAASSAASQFDRRSSALRSPVLDAHRVAIAYTSERYLKTDGVRPAVWAPLSGFFRTSDGWVRTHGNYPHHAAALREALALPPHAERDQVSGALRLSATDDAVRTMTASGALCVPVRTEQPAVDARLREEPLLRTSRVGDAFARPLKSGNRSSPLRGIRVLDLTRVIAGPVATRSLALLGADVLRLDAPWLPEPEWQHLDTGHAKRSALLDLQAQSAQLDALLDGADVVVTGYRPTAVSSWDLSPDAIAARHPGLVIARLSAWGFTGEDASRRGFDSLVQADSGIAWIESDDGQTPGALPAQALDHSAGYLLAAAVMTLLQRQTRDGGTWVGQISLRRIAAELLGLPRSGRKAPDVAIDPTAHLREYATARGRLTTTRPAIAYPGGPTDYAEPRPFGQDLAVW